LNPKLSEPEVGDITDLGLNETDEWRWTVGYPDLSNHLPGLGCNEEQAQERAEWSNQSHFHAA
jgi:hypothetical protein